MKTFICILTMFLSPVFLYPQKKDVNKEMEKSAHNAYKEILKEVDKNKDGKLSKEEFRGMWKDPKVADEKWNFWNTNKDGYLTEDEYVKGVMEIGKKK